MMKQRGNNDETMRKQEGNNEETSVCVNAMFSTHKCLKVWVLLIKNCSLSINRSNEISKLRNKL